MASPKTAVSIASPSHTTAAAPGTSKFWDWRGQKIRYVAHGEDERPDGPVVLFVHGLFVNADHWKKNLQVVATEAGCRTFGIDLLGNGYSSKPPPGSAEARALSGEIGRPEVAAGLRGVTLGTSAGGQRLGCDVALAHPLGSPYNFYTWAEQIADFAEQVARPADGKVVIVANSIGTISSLQVALDRPGLVDGVFVINPNFRELHVAESPGFVQPALRAVQGWLRANGQGLFDALATPATVKSILKEPYAVKDAVTDELVERLLTPLLEAGSADVVFDTLSYSSGPLPEQQLADMQRAGGAGGVSCAVEVIFGAADPWTPGPRVKALRRLAAVRRVTGLEGVGHCPHDEAPGVVNPLVVDFVRRVAAARKEGASGAQ